MEAQKISIPTQQLFLKVSVHKFVLKFVNQSECQEVCQLQHLCRRKFQFAFTNLYSTIISLTQTPHLPCLSHIMILFQCAYFGSLIDTLYFLCKLLAFFDYCCAKQNQKTPQAETMFRREKHLVPTLQVKEISQSEDREVRIPSRQQVLRALFSSRKQEFSPVLSDFYIIPIYPAGPDQAHTQFSFQA